MMIIKILKACYTIKWYILSMIGLYLMIIFMTDFITDSYVYFFSLTQNGH